MWLRNAPRLVVKQNSVEIETWEDGNLINKEIIEELTDYICVVSVFGHDGEKYREERNYNHEVIYVGTIEKSFDDFRYLQQTDEIQVIQTIQIKLWKNNKRVRRIQQYRD